MTTYELMEKVRQKADDQLSEIAPLIRQYAVLNAKQLMEISKAFNYFMAEQIQIAPCDHVGEVYYETMSGRFCGICQRLMEKETVNE